MFPTQITLRNLRPSPELHMRIRDLCDKLGSLNPKILSCRVAMEQPIVHFRRPPRVPPPASFVVDVQVRLPGREIAAPTQEATELEAAIRKAFSLVRRQLREAARTEPEGVRLQRLANIPN
jgi:ribosome-associated translation inhibitor RaiA